MKSVSWQSLSLREKIGQTVVFYSGGNLRKREMEDLETYPAGGAFVGAEVIKDADDSAKVSRVMDSIRRYSEASRVPLLVCSDLENGCGTMIKGLTPFPFMMALGATDSPELAYEYGKAPALEAKSIGVNWTLSPVADLNINRFNPVTNVRSVSDDPDRAKRILLPLIRGMQDHGLAATAKHFPGDGVDYRDQHLVTTANSLSKEPWWANHGNVFQTLIDAGVYCIMTGHIALPFYQIPAADGRYVPATLSQELTTRLLKNDMGFKGVVVSDALLMGGMIRGHEEKDRTQQEIECFKAGTDLMLWPTEGYFDAMERAIESGEIPISRLEDALTRIWDMREKLGLFEPDYETFRPLSEEDRKCVEAVELRTSEQSLTLVQDRKQQIPFSKEAIKKVLIVGITPHDESFAECEHMKSEFEARGMQVDLKRTVAEVPPQETLADQYDLIVYALSRLPHRPMGPLSFFGDEAGGIWWSLSAGVDTSVVVAFGSPYYFTEYFEQANVFINAYSPVRGSQKAFVRALFGEIPFQGTSPVKL